eukprot:4648674-Pyramimonas_sp.AAC.1
MATVYAVEQLGHVQRGWPDLSATQRGHKRSASLTSSPHKVQTQDPASSMTMAPGAAVAAARAPGVGAAPCDDDDAPGVGAAPSYDDDAPGVGAEPDVDGSPKGVISTQSMMLRNRVTPTRVVRGRLVRDIAAHGSTFVEGINRHRVSIAFLVIRVLPHHLHRHRSPSP